MKYLRDERGSISSHVAVSMFSVLIGAAAAVAAVMAIISSSAPDDSSAVQSGYQAPVDPGTLINYGG